MTASNHTDGRRGGKEGGKARAEFLFQIGVSTSSYMQSHCTTPMMSDVHRLAPYGWCEGKQTFQTFVRVGADTHRIAAVAVAAAAKTGHAGAPSQRRRVSSRNKTRTCCTAAVRTAARTISTSVKVNKDRFSTKININKFLTFSEISAHTLDRISTRFGRSLGMMIPVASHKQRKTTPSAADTYRLHNTPTPATLSHATRVPANIKPVTVL